MKGVDRTAENLLYQATSFVRARGRRGPDVDDLAQHMVLEALERPGQPYSLDIAYLHALDAMDPRHTQDGAKVRMSQSPRRPLSLDAPLAPDGQATLLEMLPAAAQATPWGDALPPHGPVRAMALLYGQGYTLKEIGALFGVSESRICQVFAEARRPPAPPRLCQRCGVEPRPRGSGVRYCAACRSLPRRRTDAPGAIAVDWRLQVEVGTWLQIP